MKHSQPFLALRSPRTVSAPWFPAPLRDFYSLHEGIGRESSPENPIRICRLEEVTPVVLHDLHLFDECPLEGGWALFSGIRIGMGTFFDEIVYVTRAPFCPSGSIMAFGMDVAGPGGIDAENALEASLVLAADFNEWIERLRKDHWEEYALVPGELSRLPAHRAAELRKRIVELNPYCALARVP